MGNNMRKVSKTALRNKADRLFSLFIRSKGRCEWCGSTQNLQTAHIITRSCIKLRFEEKNVFCLCAGCHFKAHQHPLEFAEFVKKVKGSETYKWLIRESNELKPITIKFYQEIINALNARG